MNKTLLSLLALFSMLFGVMDLQAFDLSVDGIYYDIVSHPDYTCAVSYSNANRYKGNIVIPEKIIYDNPEYTSVPFEFKVVGVNNRAFRACSELTSVELPNTVTYIGNNAFEGCTNLTDVKLSTEVTSIGKYAFYGCKSLSSIDLPGTLRQLGSYAFYGCASLKAINLPDELTEISDYTFFGCNSLQEFVIPASATSIGHYAFQGCGSLTSIKLSDALIWIGNSAFNNCQSLTSLVISEPTRSIGWEAFKSCKALERVEFPKTMVTIGASAFLECSKLETLVFPGSVSYIGAGAFAYCRALKKVVFEDGPADLSMFWVWNPSFGSTGRLKELYIGRNIVSYATTTNTVEHFGKDCWYPYFSTYNSADSTYLIGVYDNVTIGLKDVPDNSFDGFPIKNLHLTESVATIGNDAFANNASLESIYCDNTVPPVFANAFFSKVQLESVEVDVPKESYLEYGQAYVWSDFASIKSKYESGIIDMTNDSKDHIIYNLQGICVKVNASAEDIDDLDPGLYIIDGKKVMKR